MLTVAAVAHYAIDGLSWPVCFVLGAIVAPTDAVAATAIGSRLGLPRRLVTLIEGESLVNDATALVAYSFAVGGGRDRHLLALARDLALRRRRRRRRRDRPRGRLRDPPGAAPHQPSADRDRDRAALRLLRVPARRGAGVSAVLAVVTVGVYVGWYTPELTTVQTRLQGDAVWEILTFMLNALLFGLVGLQLRPILDSLEGRSTASLLLDGLVVSLAVILTRLIWIYPATYIPRFLFEAHPRARPLPALAVPDADRLGGPARRRLARCGARAAAHDRLRRRLPAALVRDLPDVLRDPRDARRSRA